MKYTTITKGRIVAIAAVVGSLAILTACGSEQDNGAVVSAGSVEIHHEAGTTTLPGPAKRVVALDWEYIDDLLSIDVVPVGAADVALYGKWVGEGQEKLSDTTDVGTRQEPNLEVIASLQPDLIVGDLDRDKQIYDQLSAIAPTVLYSIYPEDADDSQTPYAKMHESVVALGKATGQEDAAANMLDEVRSTIETAASKVESAGRSGDPYLLVEAFSDKGAPVMWSFLENSWAGEIVGRIGLVPAFKGQFDRYGFNTVGVESFTSMPSNTLFIYQVQPDDDVIADKVLNNPVWQNLSFATDENLVPLEADTWFYGGPLSAMKIAEQIGEDVQ